MIFNQQIWLYIIFSFCISSCQSQNVNSSEIEFVREQVCSSEDVSQAIKVMENLGFEVYDSKSHLQINATKLIDSKNFVSSNMFIKLIYDTQRNIQKCSVEIIHTGL